MTLIEKIKRAIELNMQIVEHVESENPAAAEIVRKTIRKFQIELTAIEKGTV